MATLIPSDISGVKITKQHRYEYETLCYLRDNLPDDIKVFHSVHWSLRRDKRSGFGEIDFIVLGKNGRVILVEQKNGGLCEADGDLYKVYHGNGRETRKNVDKRLSESHDVVLNRFQTCNNGVSLYADYLIYCPDYEIQDINGLAIDRERIIDAPRRSELARRLQQLLRCDAGFECTDSEYKRIEEFFMQSFKIVPDVSRYIDYQQKTYTVMSGGLVSLYQNLRLREKRLKVQGVAGSGKSQLALYAYNDALARGLRPLLVCYNRPLSERFRALVDYVPNEKGGVINTVYGLCDDFLKKRGERLDYKKMFNNPGFWQDVFEKVTLTDFIAADKFDILIVDEGQDFQAEFMDIISLFMRRR